ncbi:MAG: leucine-rich repeat protein [Clostridia bacterium]|nr:leucine-rich repeat protein [Clostridia bacterium]
MKNGKTFDDKRLLGVLDGVDARFISDALEYYDSPEPGKTRKARRALVKRIAALAACVVLLAAVFPVLNYVFGGEGGSADYMKYVAGSSVVAENGLILTLSNDRSFYIVTGIGECTDSDITIPSHHNDIPIKQIKEKAFIKNDKIASVSIPDTVTEIGFNAFYECKNLKFELYENGFYLGNPSNPYAFLITFDEEFKGDAVIHEDTKVLANSSFYHNDNITSVKFPEGLTVIGTRAFHRCINIKGVSIPNSVKHIGSEAFWGCKSIKIVYIGSGVESWGSSSFCGCDGIENLYLANGIKTIGSHAFSMCDSLTEVSIPESVTVIEESAFGYCKKLKSVSLSSNVEIIGLHAFYGIGAYNKYGSVNYVGNAKEPYLYAVSLSKEVGDTVSFHEGTAGISQMLLKKADVKSILIDAADNRGKYLRSENNCIIRNSDSSIICGVNVTGIPEGITSIDDYAFNEATVAEEIVLPASLEKIGEESFNRCKNLKKVTFMGAKTELSHAAFENCKTLETVVLPSALTEIPGYCFFGCNALSEIIIPDSVVYLGFGCLNYCESLTEIELPGVIVIDSSAFGNCASLNSVTFSDSLRYIGSMAFSRCYLLKSVQLPDNIEYIAGIAFSSTGMTSFVHPDNVGSFESCAVSLSTELLSLGIQEGVTELKSRYLYSCRVLKEISLPSTLTALESVALFDLPALEKLYYSGTVEEWNAIEKGEKWYVGTPAFKVVCSDGEIEYPAVENDGSGYDMTID